MWCDGPSSANLRTMIPAVAPHLEAESLRGRYAAGIRASREGKKLTQAQLGKAAGLHRAYVSQVERGVVNISLDNIEKFGKDLFADGKDENKPLRLRLGTKLRTERGHQGASQEELAELARLPVLFISRVERGVVGTSVDQAEQLAKALGVSGESLID